MPLFPIIAGSVSPAFIDRCAQSQFGVSHDEIFAGAWDPGLLLVARVSVAWLTRLLTGLRPWQPEMANDNAAKTKSPRNL